MAKELSSQMLESKGMLQQPGMAHLFKLYLTSTVIYRYTSWDTFITFEGEPYEPAPIALSSYTHDRDGAPPQATITVSNVERNIIPILEQYNAFRGCKIEVRTVFVNDLDSCVLETFWIDAVQATEEYVSFSCASRIDIFDVRIPHQLYFKDYCIWVYRGDQCAYVPYSWGTCHAYYGQTTVYANRENGAYWYHGGIYKASAGDLFKITGDTYQYDSDYNAGENPISSVSHDYGLGITTITLDNQHRGPSGSRLNYQIRKTSCANTYKDCLQHNNLLRFGGFPGMVSSRVKYL